MKNVPLNSPSTKRWLLLAAAWLFLLSGASSLAYEVVWVKILTLQFGSSAWSIATVVAAFMGGLGAGSAWAGRRVDRMRRPLKVYGLLELGIAVFGLMSISLLESMGGVLSFVYGLFDGQFGIFVFARFLLSFAVLFVPTALMGASLPVLVVGLAGEKTFGKRVAFFYGINTLGAALGAALSGLYAIPALGVSGTIGASVTLGLIVTAGAFLLDRYAASSCEVASCETPPERPSSADHEPPPRLLVAAVAIAGCLGIFYQIAWTRLLIPVVGSSTYAFTIILTTFLVGIGIGSLLAAVPLVQRRPYRTSFAITLALTSLFVLIGLFLVNELPQMFSAMVRGSGHQTWRLLLSQAALAGSIILLPTCGMGAALPLAIAGWRAQTRHGGRAVGGLYAANTVGAIFGSILAGFVFLPWLGAAGSIRLATVLGLVVATVLFVSDRPRRWASWSLRLGWTGALTVIVAILLLTSPTVDLRNLCRGAFRGVQAAEDLTPETMDLMYAREGRNSTVTVSRSPQSTALSVNGKPDASTGSDLRTQYLLGHLPMFLHPQPREICIIGFGSGSTAYAVTTHRTVSSVDIVEIEEAVVDAAHFFSSVNYDVVGDPRVEIHLEDGRSFLRYREQMYDVIISEPSNPWVAGVSSLFSSEFYRLARAKLKPGGVLCQWIQFYELSDTTLRVMLNTLAAEFPNVLVFLVNHDLVCLASEEPFEGDVARCAELFRVPLVRHCLDRVEIADSYDLLGTVLRSFPDNIDMFRSTIRNTDDNLWLEYRAPIEMYQGAQVDLTWMNGEIYLANLERLFPGVSRKELALRVSRSLVRVQPRLEKAIRGLANAFEGDAEVQAELLELAKAAATRAKELAANKTRMKVVRGLIAMDKYADVIPLVQQVLAIEPRDSLAHRILGWALARSGEVTKAVEHYTEAIELQPDDYEARTNLAAIMTAVGAEDRNQHLEKALELNPRFVPAWETKFKRLLKESRREEAESELERARRTLSPESFAELEAQVGPLLRK